MARLPSLWRCAKALRYPSVIPVRRVPGVCPAWVRRGSGDVAWFDGGRCLILQTVSTIHLVVARSPEPQATRGEPPDGTSSSVRIRSAVVCALHARPRRFAVRQTTVHCRDPQRFEPHHAQSQREQEQPVSTRPRALCAQRADDRSERDREVRKQPSGPDRSDEPLVNQRRA